MTAPETPAELAAKIRGALGNHPGLLAALDEITRGAAIEYHRKRGLRARGVPDEQRALEAARCGLRLVEYAQRHHGRRVPLAEATRWIARVEQLPFKRVRNRLETNLAPRVQGTGTRGKLET